jgi:hypothetical protein
MLITVRSSYFCNIYVFFYAKCLFVGTLGGDFEMKDETITSLFSHSYTCQQNITTSIPKKEIKLPFILKS